MTPLVEACELTAWGTGDSPPLWLKCENLQAGGAFKIRGAFNLASQIPEENRRRGLITFSSGNHGLAVALTARRLGIPAVVVMPVGAPAVKVDGARALGAEVLFEGRTTLQRKARAETEAAARGMSMVPPFDHEATVAGQGTIGLEILEQRPDVATVYVPISGGGLVSGIAAAIKLSRPSIRVVGVEPARAARMTASLSAGFPVTIEAAPGIADGLMAVRPGDLEFRHVRALVDRVVTVGEEAIVEAVRWLFAHAKLAAEPSGAASVAAALADARAGTLDPAAPRVAVISGGNVEASAFARYLAG